MPLSRSKPGTFWPMLCFGMAFSAFANLGTSLAEGFFDSVLPEYTVDFGDSPQGILGFLLVILSTAVCPALTEEFAFRGICFGTLRKYGDGFAILTSAVLFGLLHGNFIQIPFAFLMGLVLAYSVVVTGSMRVGIWIHFFNNLISTFFDEVVFPIDESLGTLCYFLLMMFFLLLGIVFAGRTGNRKEWFCLSGGETESTGKQKGKWFFTSPFVIIFIVLSLLEAITYFF